MPRTKWLPCLVLLTSFSAAPGHAQVAGRPIELSAGGGLTQFDGRDHLEAGLTGVGSIGYRWSTGVSLEYGWLGALSKRDAIFGKTDHTFTWSGLDVRFSLRDPSERYTPFLLAGFGYGRSHDPDLVIASRRGTGSAGAGVLLNVFGRERGSLRLQVRDVLMQEVGSDAFSNHLVTSLAFQWTIGGRSKDQDLDGVRNWLDQCPNTPVGAKVDAKGCPIDTDGDAVFDGLDKCEGTPKGARVSKDGCPLDADGDGVADGIDTCDSTAKGARVDARGCPMDTDGDGIFDGLDQCENTPRGAVVDDKGCPVDTDGDGVADGVDQCPNTPAGLRVDANGCPIEVSEKETQLLDTGMIRLQNINFDVNKATLRPESFPVLDEVAAILLQYPALTLEIGGHTDNTGTRARNVTLSEARAKSVLNYLLQKYPTLDGSKFTAVGYGPMVPVASNNTALGKAKNRRVEFRVTNAEVLKVEREKRRFLQRGETVPDSTRRN
jgi:outer membrane protein OmpA-like peptidoglycan-associated protein